MKFSIGWGSSIHCCCNYTHDYTHLDYSSPLWEDYLASTAHWENTIVAGIWGELPAAREDWNHWMPIVESQLDHPRIVITPRWQQGRRRSQLMCTAGLSFIGIHRRPTSVNCHWQMSIDVGARGSEVRAIQGLELSTHGCKSGEKATRV